MSDKDEFPDDKDFCQCGLQKRKWQELCFACEGVRFQKDVDRGDRITITYKEGDGHD